MEPTKTETNFLQAERDLGVDEASDKEWDHTAATSETPCRILATANTTQ